MIKHRGEFKSTADILQWDRKMKALRRLRFNGYLSNEDKGLLPELYEYEDV